MSAVTMPSGKGSRRQFWISSVYDVLFYISYGFYVKSVQCFACALLAILLNSAIDFKDDLSIHEFDIHTRDGRDYTD
jgi:hypothetical protein